MSLHGRGSEQPIHFCSISSIIVPYNICLYDIKTEGKTWFTWTSEILTCLFAFFFGLSWNRIHWKFDMGFWTSCSFLLHLWHYCSTFSYSNFTALGFVAICCSSMTMDDLCTFFFHHVYDFCTWRSVARVWNWSVCLVSGNPLTNEIRWSAAITQKIALTG